MEIKNKTKNLSFYDLLKAYLVVFIILFYTLPTIYIRNEIYLVSRTISDLRTKKDVLLEENQKLKRNIETLRYKNEVTDPIEVMGN